MHLVKTVILTQPEVGAELDAQSLGNRFLPADVHRAVGVVAGLPASRAWT